MAIRHSPAFHNISCHGCSQWWTPLLSLSFPCQSSSTSLRSFISCTGWKLQSGLHSNRQSSCTSVYTSPHLQTLLTSFVRWQMSRLVSDYIPVPPDHWLSAAPDFLPLVTRAFRVAAARVWNSLPDLVTFAPSVAVFRSRLKTHLFNISHPFPLWLYSACAVTLVALDTVIVLACLLTYSSQLTWRERFPTTKQTLTINSV